jgi:hypothetical protein
MAKVNMRRRLTVAVLMLILASPGLLFGGCVGPSTDVTSEAEAAIIDQLYALQPNQEFIDDAMGILNGYGFEVDVYQGDEVNVDLYRSLPAYDYKLIIFRAHAGLLSHQEESQQVRREATAIFTNEPYTTKRHVEEQQDGQLARARVAEGYPEVFAIGARFVKRSMEGQFEDTVVIMMGCNCIQLKDLAQAFVDTGASIYLAWDGPVALDYVDSATTALLQKLYSDGLTLEEAVAQTMAQEGPDPNYGAVLQYYPPDSGNLTTNELTR